MTKGRLYTRGGLCSPSHLGDDARQLVPGDDGVPGVAQVIPSKMDVGVTDAAVFDVELDVVGSRLVTFDLHLLEFTVPAREGERGRLVHGGHDSQGSKVLLR